jgi:hypothetical protein
MKAKQFIMISLAVLMEVTVWAAEMPTEPLFCFYGPEEPLFNKTFVLNDIELVK